MKIVGINHITYSNTIHNNNYYGYNKLSPSFCSASLSISKKILSTPSLLGKYKSYISIIFTAVISALVATANTGHPKEDEALFKNAIKNLIKDRDSSKIESNNESSVNISLTPEEQEKQSLKILQGYVDNYNKSNPKPEQNNLLIATLRSLRDAGNPIAMLFDKLGFIPKTATPAIQTIYYKLPGTVNKDLTVDIGTMLQNISSKTKHIAPIECRDRTEMRIKGDPSKLKTAIKKELQQKNHSAQKAYTNLDNSMIDELSNIIQSDTRFLKMFTIHSALRLIDRFVDFKSNIPKENQCKKIIDSLIETIQTAMKAGTDVEIRLSTPKGQKPFINPRLIISDDLYSQEAKKWFGTSSLEIMLGNSHNEKHKGIIVTLFSTT